MKQFETVDDAVYAVKRHGGIVEGSCIKMTKRVGLKVFGICDFLKKHGYFIVYK